MDIDLYIDLYIDIYMCLISARLDRFIQRFRRRTPILACAAPAEKQRVRPRRKRAHCVGGGL